MSKQSYVKIGIYADWVLSYLSLSTQNQPCKMALSRINHARKGSFMRYIWYKYINKYHISKFNMCDFFNCGPRTLHIPPYNILQKEIIKFYVFKKSCDLLKEHKDVFFIKAQFSSLNSICKSCKLKLELLVCTRISNKK